ncbi:hypothetical protein KXD93_00585 [Mucilaginibacter sp. BJC16-A38]|uniref:hypothetical protein n=1 Tax=Mucilaginibacter phenanthrenivorans TaxID=1234842 RepID=UPI0021581F36|nr:hypothetical protein [Mucilaginibacter phenanthrenivorans]MCR8556114.1 hypothetical protein [Mucilaginibacter phenanthrenivorans]
MTKDELIDQLVATFGKTKVNKLSKILKQQGFALRDLIDLTFREDKTIAFRAAWLLENTFLINPVSYLPDLDYLLTRFHEVVYPSCQRHYAKIMMHITSSTAHYLIREKLQDTDLEPVVEKCFDWMIDPKVKVAVKVFSADVLFNLRTRYPWITEELTNQIKFLMRNGSPGIQSRGKRLLAALGA